MIRPWRYWFKVSLYSFLLRSLRHHGRRTMTYIQARSVACRFSAVPRSFVPCCIIVRNCPSCAMSWWLPSSTYGRSHKTFFWPGSTFLPFLPQILANISSSVPEETPSAGVQRKNGDKEALGNFSLPSFLFKAPAHPVEIPFRSWFLLPGSLSHSVMHAKPCHASVRFERVKT
jgi:hypothetical protein